MSLWLGFLILYGIPILLILSGVAGILSGQLRIGRDMAEGWMARVLGVCFIVLGSILAYVLRYLNRGHW
jgi:hypothetical protein